MNAKTGGRVRYSAQWSSDIQVKGTIGREGLCTATVMQIPSKGFAHLRSHRSPGRSWGGESGSLRAGDPERPADPQSQPAPSQSPWSPTESCFWERGQSRVTTMRRPPTRSDTPAVQSEISSMTLHYNTKWQSELRVILGKITQIHNQCYWGLIPELYWAKCQRWVWEWLVKKGSLPFGSLVVGLDTGELNIDDAQVIKT